MSDIRIKALIVEDDEAHAELVEAAFEDEVNAFNIVIVSSLKEARLQIESDCPDIVITDINLPDGKGSELVPQKNSQNSFPVIVMTSFGNEKLAVENMKLGVMDYIVKSNHSLLSLPYIAKSAFGEWKAMQQKLLAETNSKRLATAMSQVGESIMITDIEGIITYVNPFFEKITGYSYSEVVGLNADFLSSKSHNKTFYDRFQETKPSDKGCKESIINRKKDGSTFEEESVITPVVSDSGIVTSYVTVTRDVTKERLLERQYQQSQKMASIGHFANKVTHDFTNALNVILGNNDLVRNSISESSEALQYVDRIDLAIDRVTKLNSQLLAFAHPSKPQIESIKLKFIINGLTEILKKALPSNITTVIELDNNGQRVSVDPSLIEQAIIHLAINSAESMPDGGTVTISTNAKPLEVFQDEFESITISDTGCGIEEEQQRHIFDPFFSTKDKFKNAGLGLSTVFKITEQHNGRILVDSTPGVGTNVTILLPKNSNYAQTTS